MFHDNEENDWTYSKDGVFVAAGEIKTTGFLLDHVRKRSDAPAIQTVLFRLFRNLFPPATE